MTKSDLIEALANKEGIKDKEAFEIVNMIFDGFTNTLKDGGKIEIRGFASFSVRKYRAYQGRNPRTGKAIEVKPKRGLLFKVGKELKAKVNGR